LWERLLNAIARVNRGWKAAPISQKNAELKLQSFFLDQTCRLPSQWRTDI
jgi:hypothetical protein